MKPFEVFYNRAYPETHVPNTPLVTAKYLNDEYNIETHFTDDDIKRIKSFLARGIALAIGMYAPTENATFMAYNG